MKSAVIVFPGSNCDRDAQVALRQITGQEPAMVWHTESDLPKVDLVVLPGGFSYGDYLRCGAMASHSNVMKAVKDHAEQGGLLLGICNGFQILVESHLLPGAMLTNKKLKFISRNVHLKVENRDTPFSKSITGETIRIPIANHDGCYFADDATLDQLEQNGQVVFRYCDETGAVNDNANVNGSLRNIAGICNDRKNVLGMMPHPERAVDTYHGGTDGAELFKSMVEALA